MLEKMFTTKMSADKKKLQNRFSKIRSKDGKTSKFTAFVLFAFILLLIAIVSICVAVNQSHNKSEITAVNTLYELKGTYIGDAPTVRKIIDLANNSAYNVDSIELKTDSPPYRLIVNFKVDSRSNYRQIDKNELNRLSGMVFALVQNADEILCCFYDDYSKDKNDTFYSAYYTRENLCERINKITPEYINSSVKDIKTFEEYYQLLISSEIAVEKSEFLDEVYKFIGEDREIVVNSAIGTDITIDNLPEYEVQKLEWILGARSKIGKYYGSGITTHLIVYDVNNFKTGGYSHCAFLYHLHPDEGLVIVAEAFLSDSEYEDIKDFIIKHS